MATPEKQTSNALHSDTENKWPGGFEEALGCHSCAFGLGFLGFYTVSATFGPLAQTKTATNE
jgi:hypothetical protein